MNTANLPEGMTRPDTISKWLVITRAAVFSMTAIWSGLIGGLLAVEAARLTRRGAAIDWALLVLAIVGLVRRPRRQQHDQRLLRPRGRRRHRRLRPGALRAAPDPVGLGDEAPARRRDPARQRDRPRDHARPRSPSAGRSSSPSRWPACSSRSSTSPRRSGSSTIGLGEPGVFLVWGPLMVGGTFFVATGEIPGWVLVASLPVRDPRDDRAVRQAHRQDRGRHEEGRPDAAGHPRRAARPRRRLVPDDRVLPDRPRRGRGRLDRAVGGARRARHPAARRGPPDVRRRPDRSRRRTATSAGRCGSSVPRSSTPAGPVACSSSGCS